MAKVVFSENARNDLKEIVTYTRDKWGKAQALTYIDGLKKQTQILSEIPTLGKAYPPYSDDGVRVFRFEKHFIYYCQNQQGIAVIHVTHQRMDQTLHVKPLGAHK